MIYRSNPFILFIVCVVSVLIIPVRAENTGYDHFLGTYAFEATPYWEEFEIIRSGSSFTLQIPDNKDWKLTFKMSNGLLVGEGDEGKNISLCYDQPKEHYTLAAVTQMSTLNGIKEFPEKFTMVKVVPRPGKKLETIYGVSAASLVKGVRQSEEWIHQAQSLQITAKDKWTNTPEGIEHRRKKVKARYHDADLRRERFWGLVPEQQGGTEVCFDHKRFRLFRHSKEKNEKLQVWDGRQYVFYEKHYTHEQEGYVIRPQLGDYGNTFLLDFMWPRSYHHRFWWQGKEQNEFSADDWYGRPEEFILTGKQNYRGTPCYVLECYPKRFNRVRRWFVGVQDGLLYGSLVYDDGQLTREHWTGNYKQVQPGWWYPTEQGYYDFETPAILGESSGDDDMKYFVSAKRDIFIEKIEVNRKLVDELFKVKFKEGMRVVDFSFGGVVTYPYKADRTDEEWKEIHKKARQRAERDSKEKQSKDALIGKPAPSFPENAVWLNSKALTWQALRGNVVILDFWAEWCGPCRNDLPVMSSLGNNREETGIIVIGIHTPGSEIEDIRKVMKEYDLNYPICIDIRPPAGVDSWGEMYSRYGVDGIPYAFVIDQNSNVAMHGRGVSQVLGKAYELARKKPDTQIEREGH